MFTDNVLDLMRILSAGCSSGEEAYLIVITLQNAGLELRGVNWQVDACDLNPRRLATAREASYDANSLRGVSPEVRARHFDEVDGKFILKARHRKGVRFFEANLVDPLLADRPPEVQDEWVDWYSRTARAIARQFANSFRDPSHDASDVLQDILLKLFLKFRDEDAPHRLLAERPCMRNLGAAGGPRPRGGARRAWSGHRHRAEPPPALRRRPRARAAPSAVPTSCPERTKAR